MKIFIVLFFLFSVLGYELPALSFEYAISKKQAKQKTENEKTQIKKKEPVKINESEYEPILIGKLLENPGNFIGKKIKLKGKFSSFTTLALDYGPALRKAKDYISLCIFRPDSMIPLSELKLAYPLKEAKENPLIIELEEDDLLEIYGQVFSAALDEPWVDIISLKNLGGSSKKEEKIAQEKNEDKLLKDTKKNTEKSKEKK